MKDLSKNGFTIVELVIVIAVIAILAAVLIPTFSGIIQKANLSNDTQVCRNMNTTLATGFPTGVAIPENVNVAKEYLKAGKFENSYLPKTSGYHYWWCELDNQVYLVNDYEEAFDIYFPETETNVNDTNSYRIDLEYYTITCKIEGVTIDKKVAQIDETENFEIICYGDVPSAIDVKENNESKLEGSFEINGNIITIYKVSGNIEILSNSSNKSTTEPVDCLASGTKITMADGSIKNIESVKEGDFILTFNHITGKYEGQKVYLTYKGETEKTAFTLNFSDGKKLSIIGDHALFEKESNTYVSIFENTADNFIGKHFYNASSNDYVKLLSVTYETEPTDYYEIYTEYNANCIAENMLNAPYDVINFLIVFDYNSDLTTNMS